LPDTYFLQEVEVGAFVDIYIQLFEREIIGGDPNGAVKCRILLAIGL
jgi:hypothetical protein